MSPNWHPSAKELVRWLRGELPDTEAGRVVDHVDTCPDCQAALEAVNRPAPAPIGPPPEIPGFTLLDDGKPIGAGGMGEVFRAVEDGIGREVAVKIVHRCHAANPHRSRLVFRFVEEVRLLGRMQHTGVPPVYRFGFLGDGADHPYLVMRLIPWPTLADELAADWAPGKGGPTPDRLNLYLVWFGRACEAVGYAHSRGAVHLDLKPANIKVHPSGEVQVLDWGLGRGFMATPDGRTQLFTPSAAEIDIGPVGHTAEYSPPEQIRGGHPDRKMHPRADVFALGAVLCEILTGRPAFAGATAHESYDRAWNADLADALARLGRAEGGHPQLVALARRCLAPEPEGRPESAGVVAAEVRRIILSAEDRLRTTRWRFRMWSGVAAAVALAAATAGAVAYRESEHERKEAQNKLQASVEKARADDATRALAATERGRVERQAEGHLRRAEEAERTTTAGDFARPAVREVMAVGWRLAAEQAKAADDAISGQAVDAELVERVKTAARRIGSAHAAFAADKALLDALDVARVAKMYPRDPDPSVRFSGAYFYSRRRADEYPAALRLAQLYTDSFAARENLLAAVRARRPEVRAAVVAAFDHWFLLDRRDDQRWMLKLADELDDDPGREAVRSALRVGSVRALLAEQPDLRAVDRRGADPARRARRGGAGRGGGAARTRRRAAGRPRRPPGGVLGPPDPRVLPVEQQPPAAGGGVEGDRAPARRRGAGARRGRRPLPGRRPPRRRRRVPRLRRGVPGGPERGRGARRARHGRVPRVLAGVATPGARPARPRRRGRGAGGRARVAARPPAVGAGEGVRGVRRRPHGPRLRRGRPGDRQAASGPRRPLGRRPPSARRAARGTPRRRPAAAAGV
ncbi:protein kinase [bacterium]|nr:protein kinase [bacterium]